MLFTALESTVLAPPIKLLRVFLDFRHGCAEERNSGIQHLSFVIWMIDTRCHLVIKSTR